MDRDHALAKLPVQRAEGAEGSRLFVEGLVT